MRFLATILFAVSMFVSPAFALDTTGMTKKQIAQLEQVKNDMLVDKKLQTYNEYAEIGEKIGLAIVSLGKELGKSVDEIMNTTTGKIAMAIIIYKVIGAEILGIFLGIIWFIVFYPGWVFMYRFILRNLQNRIEHHDENGKIIVEYEKGIQYDENFWLVFWGMMTMLIIGSGTGFIIIA